MSYNLLLDDDVRRTPQNIYSYTNNEIYLKYGWTIVRNFEDFVKQVEYRGVPRVVTFDHDLNDAHYKQQGNINYDSFKEKTGFHCAKWLIDYCIDKNVELPEEIYIHTMNVVGAMNIKSLFTTYYKVYPTDSDFYINDVRLLDGFYVYYYSKGVGCWDNNNF